MNPPISAKESARKKLESLIKEFTALEAGRGLQGQSEEQARVWINKVLEAFGWKTADPDQVVHEYSIKGRAARRIEATGSHHRRPDYALFVEGKHILYIDAKRFDVNIKEDSACAFQVRTYGWSAGLTLSYAFDFEEFAVYDCRFKPESDHAANVARVFYLHYSQYLDHFDELWDYLGREAIVEGSLEQRHPTDEVPRGALPLDQDFEAKLSTWRKEIAKSILRYGHIRDPKIISAAAQRILDRIIFLRFCEEIGLEEYGTLQALSHDEDGFWPAFMKESETRWQHVYDGVLFPHSKESDPTGVEAHLQSWWLKGRIFKEVISSLYSPNPYRFDAIPLELIGGIYERYLGKRLKVVGNDVEDEFKPEHQRTRGAVYTPEWVVNRILDRTLRPLVENKNPDEILTVKIIDPACGSGSFLLGAYEYLERWIVLWCLDHPDDSITKKHAVLEDNTARLKRDTARRIITDCLHGLDIDPEAVEVARMSLALRCVERTAVDEAATPKDLLHGIGMNIKHGNALMGTDGLLTLDPEAFVQVVPFNWEDPKTGFGAILAKGGFDAAIGNPPYIEVKRYKEWMPLMYEFLKTGPYVTTKEGKTDIAMPFIEKTVSLLKDDGRMGFIVQNRFFRTEYGVTTRHFLLENKLLERVEDFRDIQIFAGRTTYTAILILRKGAKEMTYRTFSDRPCAERDKACLSYKTPLSKMDDDIWCLDQPELLELHRALAERHGCLGQHKDLSITVGLQVLWNKLYQLQPVEETPRTVRGINGLGQEVVVERSAVRPLCRNRGFYPFRTNNADAWVIFPYAIKNDEAHEILWDEFQNRFPRTATYLQENKRLLTSNVEVPAGRDRWHLYTRPQNLVSQTRPKVLFPMTIQDSMAVVDTEGMTYQDNVNVNSLSIPDNGIQLLHAFSAVFNSSLFSALAMLKTGLNDSGWHKFNRQYADRVPFPFEGLRSAESTTRLADLANKIQHAQETLLAMTGEGQKAAAESALTRLWQQLDDAVCDLYGLTTEERAIAAKYPRQVDRIELLYRQAKDKGESGED